MENLRKYIRKARQADAFMLFVMGAIVLSSIACFAIGSYVEAVVSLLWIVVGIRHYQTSEKLYESLEANRELLSIIEEQRNLIKQLLDIREEVENEK